MAIEIVSFPSKKRWCSIVVSLLVPEGNPCFSNVNTPVQLETSVLYICIYTYCMHIYIYVIFECLCIYIWYGNVILYVCYILYMLLYMYMLYYLYVYDVVYICIYIYTYYALYTWHVDLPSSHLETVIFSVVSLEKWC